MNIIFKIIISIFILLNITVLVMGTAVMHDIIGEKKMLESQLVIFKTKEDDAYEKLDILKQSREEQLLALKTINEDIDYLDTSVQNHAQNQGSSLSSKMQLEQSIASYQKQNTQLEKKISVTQQQLRDAQRATIKARTRSS